MNSIVLDTGCSAAKLLLFVITAGIVMSTMSRFPEAEALPIGPAARMAPKDNEVEGVVVAVETHSRQKRAAISSLVDMTRIRNPCGPPESSTSGPRQCATCTSALLNVQLVGPKIDAIMRDMGDKNQDCSGMQMSPPIRKATITAGMSDTDKLKEIYKSLIHHVTYVTLIAQRYPSGSPLKELEASLLSVQGAIMCKLGSPYAEFDPVVNEAGSIDVPTSTQETDLIVRECLVINSTKQLLDTMNANIALFEN